MPGNGVGDRIHNFFGQEKLIQGQHHSQIVDGTWHGLTNNLWAGSQRQIDTTFISNLKYPNVQQAADYDRGHGGQSSGVLHGVNLSPSNLKPDLARSQSRGQQPILNGYMPEHQVDTAYNQQNITSKGFSSFESELGNGPDLHNKNSRRITESPADYDFFRGQHQRSSHSPGMLQSLPRQQSGNGDMQLLEQQFMLNQIQEMQRQQRHQKQHEASQLTSMTQFTNFAKPAGESHSPSLINDIPFSDGSNYSWQPELMAPNTNWTQHGAPSIVKGPFRLNVFSPEPDQVPHLINVIPWRVDQSLYGVPISGARVTSSEYSSIQMDKLHLMSGNSNSFPGNQHTRFQDEVNLQAESLVSGLGYQERNIIGTGDAQVIKNRFDLENLQHNHQKGKAPVQEFCERQDVAGSLEASHEKTVTGVGLSHNVATLDPTEEKILFGSDDNLWDAFSDGPNLSSGGRNISDGTDDFGAFPSVQSGSWSALMQSAVAETSSGDMGAQKEWAGLTVSNNEPLHGNQQRPTINDSGKWQPTCVDNSLLSASTMKSKTFPLSDDTQGSVNFYNVLEVRQSVAKNPHEQSQILQTGFQRFNQQFQGNGNRWLDHSIQRKEVREGSNADGRIPYFSDVDANAKNISGSLTIQQSASLYNSDDQPRSKPDGWNFLHSVLPRTRTTLKNRENENSFRGAMEVLGQGASTGRADSFSTSAADLEHGKSNAGGPQVNRNNHEPNDVAPLPDSSSVRANQESSQNQPNSCNIDICKIVDPTVNTKQNEIPGNYQPCIYNAHHNFESAGNKSLSNGKAETHEMQNSSINENLTDGLHNVSHHASSVGLREHAWSHAKEYCVSPGRKQKSSSSIAQKPPGVRKFQYHPMGNLEFDSEPYHDAKQVSHPLPKMQHISQGLKGHGQRFTGPSKHSAETGKGCLASVQGDAKGLDEISSKRLLQGSAPSISAPSIARASYHAQNEATESSQNMLQLLQKVDKSKVHGNSSCFSSSSCNHSFEMIEAEHSDGSVHVQQNQSSASRDFGLQLTPPSQQAPNHALLNQRPAQTTNALAPIHLISDAVEKGRTWLASTSFVQSLPSSHETSQGKSRNNSSSLEQTGKNTLGNLSAVIPPSLPFTRNLPHIADTGTQAKTNRSASASLNGFASQLKGLTVGMNRAQTNQLVSDALRNHSHNDDASSAEISQNYAGDSAQQLPASEVEPAQHCTASANLPSKVYPTVGTSVSSQKFSFGSQPFKVLSYMSEPNVPHNYNSETTSRPHMLEDQSAQSGESGASESGACSENSYGYVVKEQLAKGDSVQPVSPEKDPSEMTVSTAHGKGSVSSDFSVTSLSHATSTGKEFEAFGQSLRSNDKEQQSCSLLHQVQGMRNTELDPSNRNLKRFRGPNSALDAPFGATQGGQLLYGNSNMIRDALANRASILSGDSKMLSFSAPGDRDTNAPLQDSLAFGQSDAKSFTGSNAASAARGQQSQISLQTDPSLFDQYGTLKNGLRLPMFEARPTATIKTPELSVPLGRASDKMQVHGSIEHSDAVATDSSQHDTVQNSSTSTLTSLAGENVHGLQLASFDADTNLVVARLKKRQNAMSDLVPLHKEVMHAPQRLQNLSTDEVDWAQATHRLTEMMEDEAEMVDDGPPVLRSKRRLIFSTKLMQLLLRPPVASVLSEDAISHYDSAAYSVARSTVGDACNRASGGAGSRISEPLNSATLHYEEVKASGRICDRYLSKVTEDLISRGRKLESELLKLDDRASVLDLRLECQDLEKFSVINRFARFHGRSQPEVAKTSSSSDSSATTQKFPQRYVTALPIPRNFPDRVQCLSL